MFYLSTQTVSRVAVVTLLLSGTLVVADDEQPELNLMTAALIGATRDTDDDVRLAAFSELGSQPRPGQVKTRMVSSP